MKSLDDLNGVTLHGGILIESIEYLDELVDVIGRPATGWTRQIAHRLQITLISGLSEVEQSVTMYHEVIEGAMGVHYPDGVPISLQSVNEAEIDDLALQFHQRFGFVSHESLNHMLLELGF